MTKVLIVDDEPDIVLMLRLNLEAEGHEVVTAENGAVALDRVRDSSPDLMVLDVMMPVLDGWSVLEQLSAIDDPPPVIVVSAKSSGREIVHAVKLGASDYLTKPFDPDELVLTIDRVLGRSASEREAHRQSMVSRYGA